jgi:orotate phosphoribosyltransferase
LSEELLEMLRQAGAVLEGHFKLTSGRHSGTYFEKFQVLQYPTYTQRLCGLIADHFRGSNVELVAGPTTGGVILSFEVARQLGLRGTFAETVGDERRFLRGFRVNPGERVLIVDDVLTTGGSIRQVIDAVRRAGGEPVGVGVLVDRTGGKVDFGLPFFACLELVVPSYEVSECPLCREGMPLTET